MKVSLPGHKLCTVTTFTDAHAECSCGWQSDTHPFATGSKSRACDRAAGQHLEHLNDPDTLPIETPEPMRLLELQAKGYAPIRSNGTLHENAYFKEVETVTLNSEAL